MLDCLIVGDSIAVGTAMARPECVAYAKGGWNSWQWNKDYLAKASAQPARTIIISLGANDHKGDKPLKVIEYFGLTLDKIVNPFHTMQSFALPRNTAIQYCLGQRII
jgi:hypothetical protein